MIKIEIDDYKDIAHGENINQQAGISPVENGVEYEVLTDRDLAYVDYLDFTNVLNIVSEFFDVNSVAISKENHLCAVSLGSSIENAYQKAVDCNPLSITQGTIGFSKTVTPEIAKQLKQVGIKNVLAPKFDKEALKILQDSEFINIIQVKSPLQELLGFNAQSIKVTPFGYLVQEPNLSKLTKSSFKVAGKTKPTQQQAEDAIFAWKVSKYTKSNSAVVVKNLSTLAIIEGINNSLDATEQAIDYACEGAKDAVLALDGVIEQEGIINATIQGRIGLIIEAGNGYNSSSIAKLADKYNLVLIRTGIRNYKY